MPWDPVLLRKYNNTGHFRLLNQLRSELKAHPLNRQQGEEQDGGRVRTGPLVRAVEVRPQAYGRQRRYAGTVPAPNLPPAPASPEGAGGAGSAASFRDRLNAIEMR